jgi:tetratricopeptide (TPR) repeat protein
MARFRLAAPALVALAVAVHAPTLGHRFLLDDGVQIFRNHAVTAGAPLAAWFLDRDTTSSRPDYNTRIYRPLRNLAFRVIARVAGVRPLAFGLANLAGYAIAALLVLALLRRLVADEAAAAWATALWIVLPVHVEPVAYASALGDLLSLALELGAVVVALPLLRDGAGARGRYAASTALAAASMLAKEMAVTEPALLVLVAIALGGEAWRSRALRTLVALHAVAAVGYLALRTHVVGAMGQEPISAATLAAGLRDAPWLLAHYLWISVAPLGHAAAYRVPPPGALALVATVVAIAAAFVVSWRWRRTVAVGLLWFAISLLPVLHLVPLWADLADRFALFPTVGLALAVAAGLAPAGRRAAVVVAALIVVYAAASVVEARSWRSDSILWRDAVDRQPDAPLARFNLAQVLLGEGRLDEAAVQLEALHALAARADVELRRGYVAWRLGRADDAARAVAMSLRMDPSSGLAHAVAGQLALAAGDRATGAREHAEARRLAPAHPSTGLLGHELLGVSDERIDYLRALQALALDDADGAARAARDCLRRSPGRAQCQAALGQALVLQSPMTPDARTLLDRCVATLPDPERQHCQEALWSAR